ncbi:MAG: response regulator [Hyphomonadaceae bacterium]|nr:response regulator [Hyphomonadaceae bacterium]
MALKDRIAAHLPFLRRYARALTGSQASGDAYVRAALEALIAGGAALDEALPPRVALHKLLHTVWSSVGEQLAPQTPGGLAEGSSPEERIQGLSPKARQALLLNALEGFSFRDIGAVLGVTAAEAERLSGEAQEEIDRELATDVLVIEDEAMIALDIQELTEELGHRVTSIARTRAEAVAQARQKRPGLVLADIQLADASSGIDAVKDILKDFDAPVIFVTAYPERLLTGDRPEPAYLITKPFDRLALKATIGQALFFHRRRAAAA